MLATDEIQTHDLMISRTALQHTDTSAPESVIYNNTLCINTPDNNLK